MMKPYQDDNRERILVMCYSFYGGGAEKVACWLGKALSDEYRVFMLRVQEKSHSYLQDENIPVISLQRLCLGRLMEPMWYEKLVAWIKSKYRIQTAISFLYYMNMVNIDTKGNTRTICSERNNPAKREPENMERIKELYELADHVVFQTSAVRDLFSESVKEHSTIIPNPVNVRVERGESLHRIVSIGRLSKQKNQAMLIRAFHRFHLDHPEYTLSIYGEGTLRDELQQLSEKLGVADSVILEGNWPDVHQRIADAEFFVLSSDFEGMSNALLECMAMGFPCISTDCEGSSEIIVPGENGLLTKIGDEAGLYEAMCYLADNETERKRLGENAKLTAQRFRPEPILAEWKKVIQGSEPSEEEDQIRCA